MITWKDPPTPEARTTAALLGLLCGPVRARPGEWAALRTCPTRNAARNAKRRLLAALAARRAAMLFEVRAVGCELYGRAKKQPTLYDR